MTTLHTPEPVMTNKSPWFAATAAAAIGAAGVLLTVPAPAQAADCSQWGFPNGANGFDTGWGASLLFNAAGKTVTQVSAPWVGSPGAGTGYLNGAIQGTGLNFTWKGDGGPPDFKGGATFQFVGTVDLDGGAHGSVIEAVKGGSTSFTSQKKLVCLDAPPVVANQAPAPAPQPVPVEKPKVPTATVNADTDLYDKPSDQGGHIIGQLNSGQVVNVQEACTAKAWCTLTQPAGAAWGRDLTNN